MSLPYASMYKDVFTPTPEGYESIRELLSKYEARTVTLFVHSHLHNIATIRFHNRAVIHCPKSSLKELIQLENKVVYSLSEDDPEYEHTTRPSKLDLLLSGLNTHMLE